jgi:putative NADH-flavin reductase
MSLLIIGGTGTLGRQIVRQCLLNGLKTKCLVRNVRKATFLKEWGAELIYGDLNYPDSLVTALLDVNIIIDASTARLSDSSSVIDIDWVGKSCLIDLAASINVQKYICF